MLGSTLVAGALGFALLTADSARFQNVAAESEAEVTIVTSAQADLARFQSEGEEALARGRAGTGGLRRLRARVEASLGRAGRFDDADERRAARRALSRFEAGYAVLRTGNARRVRAFDRALDSARRWTRELIRFGSTELRAELERIRAKQRRDRIPLYIAVLLAFLLTAAAIRMFSKRVGEPLDRLKRGADRLGRGEYDHRIALEGPAEVQGLAVAFNRMAASIGASRRALEERALHDPLTGLVNRTLLASRTHAAIERGQAGCVPTLFFVDSLGHAVGDVVLQHVGLRLRRALREEATVGRVGGDEFAVLVEWAEGQGPGAGSAAIAERILVTIGAPYEVDGREFVLSASIGIAYAEPGMSFDELLRDADLAMYDGRERGTGGYSYFEPSMLVQSVGRLDRVSALRSAIEREAFTVHYQLLVDLPGDRPTAAEALVRWQDPERGLVPPADLTPLAEETGLIVPLGDWVLGEACRQAVAWDEEEGLDAGGWCMGVNLSPRQLFDPKLIERVETALSSSGLPAERLTLEITETAIMRDVDIAIARLRELRKLGVWLALDDFGTGHSSLSYLRRLPVTHVKIAREFVDQVEASPSDLALVEGIVNLAHGLGHRVIAEGIERQSQAELLTALGCDMGQGFHIARPAPAAEVARAVARVAEPER